MKSDSGLKAIASAFFHDRLLLPADEIVTDSMIVRVRVTVGSSARRSVVVSTV